MIKMNNSKELCLILGKRIKDIVSERLTNDSTHELVCAVDKLNAVIDGDFLAFHQACESELQRRDEQAGNEYELNAHLTNGIRRLRMRNDENMQAILDLTREVADLRVVAKEMTDEVGVAFDIPFEDVKKYLSYMDYYTDSILDPEYTASMNEFGWRRLLQRYVNELGHMPLP